MTNLQKRALLLKGIPISVTESKISIILEELLHDMKLEVPDTSFSHFDVMAKSFSKTLAIKTGTRLSEKETGKFGKRFVFLQGTYDFPFWKSKL